MSAVMIINNEIKVRWEHCQADRRSAIAFKFGLVIDAEIVTPRTQTIDSFPTAPSTKARIISHRQLLQRWMQQ